ncbi:MAG: non-canonical purine NTP pyrophosphatase [Spirochaetota bacterium]
MTLLLASGNTHKQREFAELFGVGAVRIPRDLGIDFDHPETGETFLENAFGKAQALHARCRSAGMEEVPVIIADDSGICVNALNGGPGLYSARFGSDLPDPPGSDADRTELLLRTLEGVEDRRAHYVCAMVALFDEERFVVAQETWHGEIATHASSGTGGFGYDPVFLLPELGKTVADIEPREKNLISHRGKAAARIRALLDAAPPGR